MGAFAATAWPPMPTERDPVQARLEWYAAVARWAPSKHNSQPWRFVVAGDVLEVWADPMRTLAETDPHRRELVLAGGAASELAAVAIRSLGREAVVALLPDGPSGPLARLREGRDRVVTDADRALLSAVAVRRTDRGPLDAAALPPDLPFLLQRAASAQEAGLRLVSTPGDRATLARLVERADRILSERGAAEQELAPWLRAEADRRPDGVPADHTRGPAASRRAEFVQRDFSTRTSSPAQDRDGPDRPIVGVLFTAADLPVDWLRAGRALASVLLLAAAHGASASYLNQPLEDPALRSELRDHLSLPGPAQMVLRLGIGDHVVPTPRRPLEDVLFRSGIPRPEQPGS